MSEFKEIKDSGERQEFDTGARRDMSGNKMLITLIPEDVIRDAIEEARKQDKNISFQGVKKRISDIKWLLEDARLRGIKLDSNPGKYLPELVLLSLLFLQYDENNSCGYISEFSDVYSSTITRLANHYTLGAEKYGKNNWRKGLPTDTYFESYFRHYHKYFRNIEKGVPQEEDHASALVFNSVGMYYNANRDNYTNDFYVTDPPPKYDDKVVTNSATDRYKSRERAIASFDKHVEEMKKERDVVLENRTYPEYGISSEKREYLWDVQKAINEDVMEKAGVNIVSCGNCGSTVLHWLRKEYDELQCPECGYKGEPGDFPDKYPGGDFIKEDTEGEWIEIDRHGFINEHIAGYPDNVTDSYIGILTGANKPPRTAEELNDILWLHYITTDKKFEKLAKDFGIKFGVDQYRMTDTYDTIVDAYKGLCAHNGTPLEEGELETTPFYEMCECLSICVMDTNGIRVPIRWV